MTNIQISAQSEDVIKKMGLCSVQGRVRIDLETLEETDLVKSKTYWFMASVFEETNDPTTYIVHELPESICKQILDFINY